MFRSDFFITLSETEEGLWQPVMRNRKRPGNWGAGFHYANRSDAEQAARRWAEAEGAGYRYVPLEEIPPAACA